MAHRRRDAFYAQAVTEPPSRDVFIRRTVAVALTLLAVVAVVWLALELSNVLFMTFVALFVAVAFEPPVQYLAMRGWRRGAATGLVFVVALLMTVGFFWALAPLFVEQVNQLIEAIPDLVASVASFLEDDLGFDLQNFDPATAGEQAVSTLQSVGTTVLGGVVGIAASIFGFLFFATTVALFSFYMIAERPQLQRTVLSFMPESQQRRALHIWDVAVLKMGGYIYSRLILAILSAAASTIFLGLLDVPFALSLGIWVGVLSQFVPVIGTYLASILPALVALTFNSLSTAIWVVIFFIAYQQIENYVISPKITKKTMEIHPAISVAAIIIGGTLMGGIGVILALPVAGIIQAVIAESRKSYDVILDGPAEQEAVDTG